MLSTASALNTSFEEKALDEGRVRYFKQLETTEENRGSSDRQDLKQLFRVALPLVSKMVSDQLKAAPSGIRTPAVVKTLSQLDPDVVALVGLSSVFSLVAVDNYLTQMTARIGSGIALELWAAELLESDAALYKRAAKRAKQSNSNIKYRRRAFKSIVNKAKADTEAELLPNQERVHIGAFVLNCILLAVPDIFELKIRRLGHNRWQRYVGMTQEASEALTTVQELQAWMHPMYKPMTVPPRPWEAFDTGAYINTKLAKTVRLVRTHNTEQIKLIKDAVASGQMDYCLEALNAIQGTRWRINTKVLDVVKWAWDQGLTLKKFPQRNYIKRQDRPENWETLDDNRKKGWRINAAKVAQRNRGIDSERIVMLQDLAVADALRDASEFYIPHNMDFRGRVYPIPHFNQQRADHIKALMEFSEGHPVDPFWLAVHVANCGDFDKVSKKPLEEREQWTKDNLDMIRACAWEPTIFTDWMKADKPFQFLAACIEWMDYQQWLDGTQIPGLNDTPTFKSHLPIALDGSNSGLQHYSAALRSPEGHFVNLIPSDEPADLYQVVADRVNDAVIADAFNPSSDIVELSGVVLKNGIDRKLVKRNCMTFAYSSEVFGFKQQLMEDHMDPLGLKVLNGELDAHPYGEDGGFAAATYLARKVWDAVNSFVPDAAQGMAFFRKCAQALAHEQKGLTWTTPIGLPVLHKYTEYDTKTVKLFLHDKAIPLEKAAKEDKLVGDSVLKQVRLKVRTQPKKRIMKAKAGDAVAPNVIHSMDASHLMMTVLELKDRGVKDFSLIHDSFAVHAAHTETLFGTVRSAFVDMYEAYDPFEEIYNQTLDALDDKSRVPEMPTKGDLDLSQVTQSQYAFS